jgi:hypothetical protein
MAKNLIISYSTSGTFTFTASSTGNYVFEGIGGGQSGAGDGTFGANGGIGADFAQSAVLSMTSGQTATIIVGSGASYSSGQQNGGDTSAETVSNSTVVMRAIGGGSVNSDIGSLIYIGGVGGSGDTISGGGGGGSAGSGGAGGNGANGDDSNTGAQAAGGSAGISSGDGFNGAIGGAGGSESGQRAPSGGGNPGAGGAGGDGNGNSGQYGGTGQVNVYQQTICSPPSSSTIMTNPSVSIMTSCLLQMGSSPVHYSSVNQYPQIYLSAGSSNGQVDKCYSAPFTVTNGTPLTINLSTGCDPFGNTLFMNYITHLLIENDATTTGHDMTLWGGSNPVLPSDSVSIHSLGGCYAWTSPVGYPITSNINVQITIAAGTASGKITILGR